MSRQRLVTSGLPQGSLLDSLIALSLTQTHWDQVHPEQIYTWRVDAMQRDLDKLKNWSCVNTEVQHGRVQASAALLGQFLVSIKAEGMKGLREHFRKDLGYLCMKSWSWADQLSVWANSQKGGCVLGQERCGQQVQGPVYVPLLHFCENPPGVLHPALGPSAQERCGPIGAGPAEGHRNDQMDWTCPMTKGWES